LYYALAKKPNRDPEEEEFMEIMYETMEQYRAEGLVMGRAEGREEGRAEGHAAGLADALLTVLQGRGIAVPDAARERIRAEKDPRRLNRWLERAGVATSIDDLLGDAR
jgi:flagellar biosynthesis/type III secretory pathway protein FliH